MSKPQEAVRHPHPREWHDHFGDLYQGPLEGPRQEMLFEMAPVTKAPQRAVASRGMMEGSNFHEPNPER